MADDKVLAAQKWVNSTYGSVTGYSRCPENGNTGWSTMYSLIMGLQHELGISPVVASFGPGTLAKLETHGPIDAAEQNKNIVRIIQHALFCKGYWGGGQDGVFDVTTITAIKQMMSNMGLNESDARVTPKLFKALLTMDAYVLVSGGSDKVRDIQRWLNGRYQNKSFFFFGPCDGHYSRDVQQALMKALQSEIGIPDSQVNGNFGPGTAAALRTHTVSSGSSGVLVQLFSSACVFNEGFTYEETPYTTGFRENFDAKLVEFVKAFQGFSELPQSGQGDYQTWAQLLVSMGDPDRDAHACDTRFTITTARAKALHDAGYSAVGRYLDEEPEGTLDKEIKPGELQAIFDAGLRCFPIWQYHGRKLADFSYAQGYDHGQRAHERGLHYGFDRSTVLYFAVDYDATDEEIKSNILPYFSGVSAALASKGRRYIAGVYGSRNVCSQVTGAGYARWAFVSGMSWGFSGNLGFPLPQQWSFNQIKEFKFTAGGDTFDLDRVVHRDGADFGVDRINSTGSPAAAFLEYIDGLFRTAQNYGKGNPSLRVMEFLRYPRYVDIYSGWENLIGDVDREWISYAQKNGPSRLKLYTDPGTGIELNADHFGATANAAFLKGRGEGTAANRGDFGGWGGDLSTFYGEWRANGDQWASGYLFCQDRLFKIDPGSSSFPMGDLIEDIDGFLIGTACKNGADFHTEVRKMLDQDGHATRFKRYYQQRHNSTKQHVIDTAKNMLTDVGDDTELAALRTAAIKDSGGWDTTLPGHMPDYKLDPFVEGYADCLIRLT
ncbi:MULTISPECIES: glycoside hydrolase domain-containing protein [Streptomyces]|uniref:Glycoside hydrolase domain-containing protein n=1 Tax=Streptomyces ramulosus TaxID=47762 RepID=A0ABW1FEY5_9ACTN